jgi:hypothetical protein
MVPGHASTIFQAALAAVVLVLAGCETAPVQEMSDARQAISVAREAGAEEHAAAELEAAIGYLQSAQRSLNERDYSSARLSALQAKENALTALELSEARRNNGQ